MRQGYYSAAPETSKLHMSEDEWGYWFEGKPAKSDIIDPFGNKLEKAGPRATGIVLRPHGPCRMLELSDDGKPLHGKEME